MDWTNGGTMSGRFLLSVDGRFSASHTLPDCPPCDRLHGHTWTVRATWVFTDLDDKGMGINFSVLQQKLDELILHVYDHNHLNDLDPFDRLPPTAENLAKAFFLRLRDNYDPGPAGVLQRVEVWEGSTCCAAYEG
jgi:6-pyruvoyltetrahydropterin/6-carboxytetrahydropterin synthase